MVSPAPSSLEGLALPRRIDTLVVGREARRVDGGWSGCLTLRLAAKGAHPIEYLKVRPTSNIGRLGDELAALEWLHGRLRHPDDGRVLTPEPIDYAEEVGHEFLLIGSVPGRDATEPALLADPEIMVRVLGEGLRLLHEVDISDCPLDQRLDHKLAEAALRVRLGMVDVDEFEPENEGTPPVALLDWLNQHRPEPEDLVLTHGDYCLPNVMVHRGDLGGFIDLGLCGVADRYQDLALAERSLLHNLHGEQRWVGEFFAAYGPSVPDQQKLEYYRQMDELF
jgi:aminoglycoside phosphotransferase